MEYLKIPRIDYWTILTVCYPMKAAKTPGKKCKSLPLHIASRNGCSSKILKMLFEAYPEALEKKNVTGQTPYQSGEGHGASQKSLDAMTRGIETH